MKEDIKIAAKITAASTLKWLVIVLIGNLFTLTCFLIILFQNISFAGGGHGNVYAFIINLFFHNTCGFILLVGAPIFAFLYFAIANKIAIQTMIHQLWQNKMGSYIDAKVIMIVDKLVESNDWTSSTSNDAMLRLKLLEANRSDNESSKIKKKVIGYIFAKIQLDDIDFSNQDLKFSNVVSTKLNNFVSETVEPSFLFFWLLLFFQLLLIIVAQFF
ncbi:hypothetical protein GKZ90_0020685 [Flavobacterium sp. MC2016-06]|jgi:hypothetical protein|uniref:hypothetical protein n=1 Tax=Flavobacterium sp. MC2016-06 TaxID=2676308 RepID=UPI0012BAFC1C|nr:hypothetical protein [Flavobacterium sp. MC2016-06]MBU3860816.1 hypothetical protein [Flavobacterium sp. MC2016-06]